jgi:hypothetical protein
LIRYDSDLPTAAFLDLAALVWPRDYDLEAVTEALARTSNVAA